MDARLYIRRPRHAFDSFLVRGETDCVEEESRWGLSFFEAVSSKALNTLRSTSIIVGRLHYRCMRGASGTTEES